MRLFLLAVGALLWLPSVTFGQGPALRAEKNVGLAIDVDGDGQPSAGDSLSYSIRIQNSGDAAATDVVLTDPIPFATTLDESSIFIDQGELLSVDPLIVAIGVIQGNLDSASVGFRVRIDDPLPPGTTRIVNQGRVSNPGLDDVFTDDPSTPEPGDPTTVTLPGVPVTVDVPALGPWGLALFAALLLGSALWRRAEDET